jgi:hypothetical protein
LVYKITSIVASKQTARSIRQAGGSGQEAMTGFIFSDIGKQLAEYS